MKKDMRLIKNIRKIASMVLFAALLLTAAAMGSSAEESAFREEAGAEGVASTQADEGHMQEDEVQADRDNPGGDKTRPQAEVGSSQNDGAGASQADLQKGNARIYKEDSQDHSMQAGEEVIQADEAVGKDYNEQVGKGAIQNHETRAGEDGVQDHNAQTGEDAVLENAPQVGEGSQRGGDDQASVGDLREGDDQADEGSAQDDIAQSEEVPDGDAQGGDTKDSGVQDGDVKDGDAQDGDSREGEDGSEEESLTDPERIMVSWPGETSYLYQGEDMAVRIRDSVQTRVGEESLLITFYQVGDDGSEAPVSSVIDAGTYRAEAVLPAEISDEAYELVGTVYSFAITPAPVTSITWIWRAAETAGESDAAETSQSPVSETVIAAAAFQGVYDGEPHMPAAAFTGVGRDGEVVIASEAIEAPEAKNAGSYTARILDSFAQMHPNYYLSDTAVRESTLQINARRVRLALRREYKKAFGERDPRSFRYDAEDADKSAPPFIGSMSMQEDLGVELEREKGEAPKTYRYSVNRGTKNPNYEVEIDEEARFTIEKLRFHIQESTITSRSGVFTLALDNLDAEKLDESIERKAVISAVWPADGKGIAFSTTLEDYISSASKGRIFNGLKETVAIKDAAYSTRRGAAELTWAGKIPAGTRLSVTLYGKGEDEADWYKVSASAQEIAVVQKTVGLIWGSTADADPASYYLSRGDRLTLAAADAAGSGEWVEVNYRGTHYYGSPDRTIEPAADNSGSKHNTQSAVASFVDVLNLSFTTARYTFVYDDTAFAIPASAIRFSNRDRRISITLPETGSIKSVTIPGAKVKIKEKEGTEFNLRVKWSGKSLIPAGTPISVTYTDQGGNEGKGTSVAARSAVQTPISLLTRPGVNRNNYLHGSGILVVSGSACACEPIRVTAADMVKTTYATQKEVWSDENGSWEAIFDLRSLPEGRPFQIAAEYMDVNGQGAAITLRYDAYVSKPALLSPVFRVMPFISGMAERGTDLLLYDKTNVYRIDVDEFGHFTLDGIRAMLQNEQFTIRVIDSAGNGSALTMTIPEVGDPPTLKGMLAPLGQFIYDAGETDSSVYTVTPVSVSRLKEGGMEIPLLLGGSYKAGICKITRTAGGVVLVETLDPQIFDDPGDFELGEGKLYVYTEKPAREALRERAGRCYAYGEQIPAAQDDTLWIVTEQELEMSLSDAAGLAVYNFRYLDEQERLAQPERYQEYLDYAAYQRYADS